MSNAESVIVHKKVVVLLSGGLDSCVLAAYLNSRNWHVHALFVNYGQRHVDRERQASRAIAQNLGFDWDAVRVPLELRGNALTDFTVDVPDGHYAAESMKTTVVPNRNGVLLNVAAAYAMADATDPTETSAVGLAAHAGDHFIYPDCRIGFIKAMEAAIRIGTGNPTFAVVAPFIDFKKSTIVEIGDFLSAPLELTWSCYRGGQKQCGKCGTCNERIEAFQEADVRDPTQYLSR